MKFSKTTTRILLLTVIACAYHTGWGQPSNSIYLLDVIHHYEQKKGLSFLFDSDLIKEIKVEIDTTELDLSTLLNVLNEQSAFDFHLDNTNVLIKPKKAGANIRVCGVILDDEEKLPMPGVSVFDEKRTFGISTGVNGRFSTYARLSSDNIVRIQMVGFAEQQFSLEVFNGGCLSIALVSDVKVLDDVVVHAYMSSGIDYSFLDNSIDVKPNGMGLLPGETDADVLAAVRSLPGIKSPDSKAGNLIIRGASPDQSLVTFDNIPIYHKGHYFGTISPYNPSAVDNVKVFRSAYSADKGGRVGGVVEVNSKSKVADSVSFGVGMSTTSASAVAEVPLGKKASVLLAGRISYPSSWTSPKLNAINDFIYQESAVQAAETNPSLHLNDRSYHFYDVNAKFIMQPGKNDHFTLSFLGIDNRINLEIQDDRDNSTSLNSMHLKNWGYNAQWNRTWSDKISSRVSVTQSLYDQLYPSKKIISPDSIQRDSYFENELDDLAFKWGNEISISSNSKLNVGYDWQRTNQKYSNLSLDSTFNQSVNTDLHSMYFTYSLFQKSKYILTAGLRNNYYNLTNDFKVEPRLMFNFFPNENWALKTSAGQFHQYVTQISGVAIESVGGIENLVWQIANETTVPIVSSIQLMAGTMFHTDSWMMDLELYRNRIEDIAINDIIDFSNAYLYGSGWTYGADLLIKKKWKNLNAWVSYSLSQSNLHFDSIQSEAFDFIYNQRNVVDIVLEYRIKSIKVSAGWKYRTGLPALNSIRAKYLHGPPSGGEQQQSPNNPPQGPGGNPPPGGGPPNGQPPVSPDSPTQYSETFPSYHQLDLSMVYSFPKQKKGWYGSLGLSLINVYNRENIIEQVPRRTSTGLYISYKYAIGFAPNLTLTMNW